MFPLFAQRASQRCHTWQVRAACVRLCCGALVMALCATMSHQLHAGCHYVAAGKQQTVSADPHGHARDFRFLGKWVYERGDIRYVAWESDGPCDGPNCQARKDMPPEFSFAPPDNVRISHSSLGSVANLVLTKPDCWSPLEIADSMAVSGHPRGFEYPP
jgi:hypothetical protein